MKNTNITFIDQIHSKIHFIRGYRVMLDSDLAELYGVETKVLNQSVRRNFGRFPNDFMFQLTEIEEKNLKSQIVTSSLHGGNRYTTNPSQNKELQCSPVFSEAKQRSK